MRSFRFSCVIVCILFASNAFAGFEEVKSQMYTQSNRSEANVKNLEKSGLVHCGNLLNKRVKNLTVKLDKDKGIVKVEFDYPSLEWYQSAAKFPLLIRVADKKGNVLTQFVTGESFVPEGVYYRTEPGTWGRAHLDGKMGQPKKKAELLKPSGNSLDYEITQRDAAYVGIVEVGFVTKIDNGMDRLLNELEFMPENKFIRDWSKEKSFQK